VHIFEYQNRVLHAKTLIIDDWATVGSHNLNHRSLNHDLEIEWMTENPKDIKILLQQWDTDIQHCHSNNMADLGRWTLWDRAIGRVAYWFRYWI
jgi:cardiolipin synthase